MTDKPYTDADVELVAAAMWRAGAPERHSRAEVARIALDALAAAGRLAGGSCPCTCHQPDRCPCEPGAPTHRHGAGGYCIASEATDHVIAFDAVGTWTMDHPPNCRASAGTPCPVRLLAERQITSDLTPLVAGGRYTCSAGLLSDVFQLDERLHDDQCTTPVCAACGCWCHAEEQAEG